MAARTARPLVTTQESAAQCQQRSVAVVLVYCVAPMVLSLTLGSWLGLFCFVRVACAASRQARAVHDRGLLQLAREWCDYIVGVVCGVGYAQRPVGLAVGGRCVPKC